MASGTTNRGKKTIADYYYRRQGTLPTHFFMVLCTDATTPTADTNTMADLTQIAAGNGYTTGGYSVNPDTTDFPTLTEDDTGDQATLVMKLIRWTASGGSLPISGTGARWAVLTDDNGTFNSRVVYHYFDLVSLRIVSDTQNLDLSSCTINITQPV